MNESQEQAARLRLFGLGVTQGRQDSVIFRKLFQLKRPTAAPVKTGKKLRPPRPLRR